VPYGALGVLAVVCWVVGIRRRGRLTPSLAAVSLVAPLGVAVGGFLGPRPFYGVLPWLMVTAAALLILGMVAVPRGWKHGPALAVVGLTLPLVLLLPIAGLLYGLLTGESLD
jgi:hypothetical protein